MIARKKEIINYDNDTLKVEKYKKNNYINFFKHRWRFTVIYNMFKAPGDFTMIKFKKSFLIKWS